MKKLFFLLIGIVFVFGFDLKDAKFYELACNNGDIKMCVAAAEIYDFYLKNYKKAVPLYEEACKHDNLKFNSEACYNLGLLYFYGKGVSKNYYKAYEYWIKAAKKGNTKAQHNLDILCREHPWACK